MHASTETLWHDFRERLHAFVRSRVASDQAANDVVQGAFLRMHQSLRDGTTPLEPQAWVFAITRSAIGAHYRQQRAQAARQAAVAQHSGADLVEAPAAHDAHAAAELARCVRPLLEELEQPYRDALKWTAFDGLTQGAAAKRANISLSGMKTRVQRGRRKLRNLFEACCAIEIDARGKPTEACPTGACCNPEKASAGEAPAATAPTPEK